MDVFQGRYFGINRRLLALAGLWPYEGAREKLGRRLFVGLVLVGMSLPHLAGMVVNFHKDGRKLLEHMGIVMLIMITAAKVVSSIANENKTLLQEDNMFNFVRYVFLCFGAFIHLFYLSWPGQKMIDHSAGLHQEAYLNEWYECSTATKKLLNIFMQRCLKPGLLTAGGLYIMNFDYFVAVVKKSISFMAVFSSFQ